MTDVGLNLVHKTYTYEEAIELSTKYFYGEEISAKVFVDKYAMRNKEGEILEATPDAMHDRLATEFARIDAEKYGLDYSERFALYRAKLNRFSHIVPQGSPMSAIGNTHQIMSASNCVVVASPEDSVSAIFETGLELAQLYKRRCVEENSLVITKENGVIPIKDTQIGMHILSFDLKTKKDVFKKITDKFDTDVDVEDRTTIHYSNGTLLNTSSKHPVLTIKNDKYDYETVGSLEVGAAGIKVPISKYKGSVQPNDIGWFIGAHIGDGSCDKRIIKHAASPDGEVFRFRLLKDNENVTATYGKIFNKLSDANCNYKLSTRKDYKVDCWEYVCCKQSNQIVLEKYLDNQYGSKAYTAQVPSIVKKDNLWWNFIAGLIDTDGTIKGTGEQIVIGLCAKKVIDDVSTFLQSEGVSIHVGHRTSVKPNEQPVYLLCIHYDENLWDMFSGLMHNDEKMSVLQNKTEHRFFSHKKPITNSEYRDILYSYLELKNTTKVSNLLAANIYHLKNDEVKGLGIGFINTLVDYGIFSTEKADEVMQRVVVQDIYQDKASENYIDIEVADTNNFYCGNYGFVVIHNCGVGIDLSKLRPDGTPVNNAARTTSGAWSFADFYSYITRMIGQNSRRGALMVTLDVHHPDIKKFATMKHDKTKVTGANVSVRLSDEFLKAVDENTDYELRWSSEKKPEHNISKMVPARDIWNAIVDSATKTAEPGLIMWDNMTSNLPADCYDDFKTVSTNPCGEVPLGKRGSCRLMSINLTGYVRNAFMPDAFFDYDAFSEDVSTAMQMIDNLVDLEIELIDKIKETCEEGAEMDLWTGLQNSGKNGRRTGLGTHGLADALAQLRIKYDGSDSLVEIEKIYRTLRDTSYGKSIDLAKERGPFSVYDYEKEKDCDFIKRLPDSILKRMKKHGRRNISILTQAPTGSVSIVSKVGDFNRYNVSSGIEPVFRNSYIRRKKINPNDKNARIDFTDDLGDSWQEFVIYHNNIKNFSSVLKDNFGFELGDDESNLPDYFVTSDKIDWQKRIELQSMEQQFLDHSISSTINLPKGTSPEVVGNLYLNAWKHGLKGVTVYVDGSRDGVLISGDDKKKEAVAQELVHGRNAPTRADSLKSESHKLKIDFGDGDPKNSYIIVSFFEDTRVPYEVFVVTQSHNLDEKDVQILELTTRNTSMSLRHGIPLQYICEQLDKIGGQYLYSIPTNIAKVLRKYMPAVSIAETLKPEAVRGEVIADTIPQEVKIPMTTNAASESIPGLDKCPSCKKRSYVIQEGCGACLECGYSGCG